MARWRGARGLGEGEEEEDCRVTLGGRAVTMIQRWSTGKGYVGEPGALIPPCTACSVCLCVQHEPKQVHHGRLEEDVLERLVLR